MKRSLAFIISIAVLLSIGACDPRRGEPGSKGNPIRFFFMPLKGDEAFAKNAPLIQKYLEQRTGLSVRAINAPDFLSIIKAFGNGQADAAFINTLGYVMARDWAGAEAKLLLVYGDVYKAYRGEIIARVGGSVNSAEDLSGKLIAFSDPFSASGYLYALKFLKDRHIKPAKIVFAGGHRKAVEMVYSGKVDAAATYHERPSPSGQEVDARVELIREHPDIMSKVKIVALTDEIPSGPVVLSHTLKPEVKGKIVNALLEFSKTPAGRSALGDLYNATGLEVTNDAVYDGVWQTLKALGREPQELVKGGIEFYNRNITSVLAN